MPTLAFLQALNGDRDHPAAPRTPDALAQEARAAVDAGAQSLHLHPYDPDGNETFDPIHCACSIRAVRAACPVIPISLSTSAGIEADPEARISIISTWTEMPDLVTANQGEPAIVALCDLLISKGVCIEAGLLSLADAKMFLASGLAARCHRVLIEPLDSDAGVAVEHAQLMEQCILHAGITLQQVHHGDGIASWAVNRRALARGHGIRTGLEDTPVLPDGRVARGNGDLIAAAVALIDEQCKD